MAAVPDNLTFIDPREAVLFAQPIDARHTRVSRLRLLWVHRRSLLFACAVGAAIAALVAVLVPVRFTSSTQLMPPDSSQSEQRALVQTLAGVAGLAGAGTPSFDADSLLAANPSDLFATLLGSRTLQDNVIQNCGLARVYGVRTGEDARDQLSRRTTISVARKSDILSLEVTDHDPLRAQAIGREYLSALGALVAQLDASAAHRERVFIEKRLDEVRMALESAEQDLARFSSNHPAADVSEQARAAFRTVARVEGQLFAEQSELEGLRQVYGDQNIRVRSAEARIAELHRQYRQLTGDSAADRGAADGFGPGSSVRDLPRQQMAYADLLRRVTVEEAVFDTLTQNFEKARVQEARDRPTIQILDAPDLPEKKVFPLRTVLIAVGLCLALVLRAAWILAREDWSHLDPQDPVRLLGGRILRSLRASPLFPA